MGSHTTLIESIRRTLIGKGYIVCSDGERKKHKRFKGIERVDLIALKDKELLLYECGWIDGFCRLQQVKDSVRTISKWRSFKVRIVWCPYVYSVNPHDWKKQKNIKVY